MRSRSSLLTRRHQLIRSMASRVAMLTVALYMYTALATVSVCQGYNYEHDCTRRLTATLECDYRGPGVYSGEHSSLPNIHRLHFNRLDHLIISMKPFTMDTITVEFQHPPADDTCVHFIDIKSHQRVLASTAKEPTTICVSSYDIWHLYADLYKLYVFVHPPWPRLSITYVCFCLMMFMLLCLNVVYTLVIIELDVGGWVFI
jgi:hypothetical protein